MSALSLSLISIPARIARVLLYIRAHANRIGVPRFITQSNGQFNENENE